MTQAIEMTDEVRALRARMKDFIDGVVFPAEAALEREAEHGMHPETGLPLELYAAAKARGDDATQGVRGPGPDVAARRGTQITAPAPGRVSFVGRKFGFGLVVEIEHGSGVVTRYAHCGTALVSVGARVQRGVPIATVGTSGLSTGPHLHYEVLVNGRQVDPLRYKILQPAADSTAPIAPSPMAGPPATPGTPAMSSHAEPSATSQ